MNRHPAGHMFASRTHRRIIIVAIVSAPLASALTGVASTGAIERTEAAGEPALAAALPHAEWWATTRVAVAHEPGQRPLAGISRGRGRPQGDPE
jgi:hypothetical protein